MDELLDNVCVCVCVCVCAGYGAALNTAGVELGSTVGVWGCGAVGLAAIMGCKEAGAKRIIAVDINPDKWPKGESLSVGSVSIGRSVFHTSFPSHVTSCPIPITCSAQEFGATEFLNPLDHDRPTQQVLVEMTDGGLDYSFECIGNVKTMVSTHTHTHTHTHMLW